jgi:hypothetical protein
LRIDHFVRSGGFLFRIAEDRVVGFDVLCELLVRLGIVDAGSKVDDILEGPKVVAALTERLALGGSASGEGLREPGKNDGLALVIRQPMHLAVGALEREVRRSVACLQCRLRLRGRCGRASLLQGCTECNQTAGERQTGQGDHARNVNTGSAFRLKFRVTVSRVRLRYDDPLAEFAQGAAVLILDAHFTPDEFAHYHGWGHSHWRQCAEFAGRVDAAGLWLFHHKPGRTDEALVRIRTDAQRILRATETASEGEALQI